MNTLSTDQQSKHFEDFVPKDGKIDLFQKVRDMDAFLHGSLPGYLDGLGLQIMGPVSHQVAVREHDSTTHEVIMMGSNSYLALNTHPRVVAACKAACDQYGYGMGAVSLYAGTSPLHRQV